MLADLMNYTQVADNRLIAIFTSNSSVPTQALKLFNHVLNAQHVWATRILGKPSLYSVWQDHSTEAFSSLSVGNFELYHHILANIDLGLEIKYTNSQGDHYSNLVKDILLHVFNHSTYHRAQIASIFKAHGIQPPVTDYIMLKRDNLL